MNVSFLPSKQFIARVTILVILLILALGVYKISEYFKNRSGKNTQAAVVVAPDVIQKDSNKNTIPDWEESLWGLDPTKDGPSNKEFILTKREALAKENGTTTTESAHPLSENETLSREFFAVIMSLQQSGNLDDTSMKAIADTIGKKIVANPIADIYTTNSIRTQAESKATVTEYYRKLRELLLKYEDKDIGNELTFISAGLQNNDPGALTQVKAIAGAYRSFAKELVTIPVPATLAATDLSLANNYEKTAQSVEGLTRMLNEPLVGMKAIINYKKYSDGLASDLQKLSDIFTDKWYTGTN